MIRATFYGITHSAAVVLVAVLLFCSRSSLAITIPTVPVGNVGNPNDPATGNLYGGVNYAYNIGKYEVTVSEYTAFLNAVAKTDTYSLYSTSMATNLNIAGISRSGSSGNYAYSVIGSPNHPVTNVSWGDAVRFANWLHNNQPTGVQGSGTTEDGAYTLNGATSNDSLASVKRNLGATWFIPSGNEWYKAAYYQPTVAGGDTDGYWAFPMKTNSPPYSDQAPGATPDNTRVANYYHNDNIANGYDDGYAVTGSLNSSSTQNYLTDVGAYTFSSSYYSTFDQAGNVEEWGEVSKEMIFYPPPAPQIPYKGHGAMGGTWSYIDNLNPGYASASLNANGGLFEGSDFQLQSLGFRVASRPNVGDYNLDNKVDAADYIIWRKNNGSVAQYNIWRANFGTVLAGVGSAATVPEPEGLLFLFLGGMFHFRLSGLRGRFANP